MAKEYRAGFSRRIVNLVVTALVGRGRGPDETYILTTLGRKTSQPRSVPVTVAHLGEFRYLVSPYGEVGWVHNIRARPVASLRRGNDQREITVRSVDPEEAAPVLKQYLTDLERIVGDYFDVTPDDSLEAFAAVADRHPVFRIEPA